MTRAEKRQRRKDNQATLDHFVPAEISPHFHVSVRNLWRRMAKIVRSCDNRPAKQLNAHQLRRARRWIRLHRKLQAKCLQKQRAYEARHGARIAE